MIVKELIEFLQMQPQEIQVAYRLSSEQTLLEIDEIKVVDACMPRPDGWIQDKRPDMPTQTYLD